MLAAPAYAGPVAATVGGAQSASGSGPRSGSGGGAGGPRGGAGPGGGAGGARGGVGIGGAGSADRVRRDHSERNQNVARRLRDIRMATMLDPRPCTTCTSFDGNALYYGAPAPLQPGSKPRFDLYLGLQSVADSDYSGSFHARGRVGWFGFEGGLTSFFERTAKPGSNDDTELLRLHLWHMSSIVRIAGPDEDGPPGDRPSGPELTAAIGLAGMSSVDLNLLALRLGLDARIPINERVGIFGSAAMYTFEDEVSAREGRVGVNISMVQLSYRVTNFNTGPALHGPEIGAQWRF